MYIEWLSFWLNSLKISNDKYTILFDETEQDVTLTLSVDKSSMGKVLGVGGNNYTLMKKLLNSTFIKYGKKINYYVNER